jgi:hypothetical protein
MASAARNGSCSPTVKGEDRTLDNHEECAGNARALHHISACEALFTEWGETAGAEIAAAACRRGGFKDISEEDVRIACKVFNALRSRDVDVVRERARVERQAQKACDELLSFFKSETGESPQTTR